MCRTSLHGQLGHLIDQRIQHQIDLIVHLLQSLIDRHQLLQKHLKGWIPADRALRL